MLSRGSSLGLVSGFLNAECGTPDETSVTLGDCCFQFYVTYLTQDHRSVDPLAGKQVALRDHDR